MPALSLLGCYEDNLLGKDMGQAISGLLPYNNMTRLTCACQCIAKVS